MNKRKDIATTIVKLLFIIWASAVIIYLSGGMYRVYEESQKPEIHYYDTSCKTFWIGYTCVDNQSIDIKGEHSYSNVGEATDFNNINESTAIKGESSYANAGN